MWAVANNRVSYVYIANGAWKEVARFEAIAKANKLDPIPEENFRKLGESSAVGMTVSEMDKYLSEILVRDEYYSFGNGAYSVVDKDNVLYTNFGNDLYAFKLTDLANPSAGITVKNSIINVDTAILGQKSRLFGLALTYDNYLVVTFLNGVAVIDRELNLTTKELLTFGNLKNGSLSDAVSNSIAIDEKNGIYIVSNTTMRKLVWDGTKITLKWKEVYNEDTTVPPIVKFDYGTGSTPTLMGFGDDQDKLVVITSGGSQMKLVAFWRDEIPTGLERKADEIPVTCGLDPLPEWIQSEQSVVVSGYGAFVVNNMPSTVAPELEAENKNKTLQVSLMGPAYPGPLGVERFEWNPVTHKWKSVWQRPDIASNSMIPAHSRTGTMVLVNGYYKESGWEVTGLDWNTGKTVHRTIFGHKNLGNGAYAIIQHLSNKSLIFNSIVGPFLVDYDDLNSGSGGGCSVTGTAGTALLLFVPLVFTLRRKKIRSKSAFFTI
ncbi:MAG: SYNERG-CTERM sorting domain-containing protein [Synergistaceae bacterium]|nr:SYNERG-CTERM sorting domain-containing protein [Synergistaceae bacterium]